MSPDVFLFVSSINVKYKQQFWFGPTPMGLENKLLLPDFKRSEFYCNYMYMTFPFNASITKWCTGLIIFRIQRVSPCCCWKHEKNKSKPWQKLYKTLTMSSLTQSYRSSIMCESRHYSRKQAEPAMLFNYSKGKSESTQRCSAVRHFYKFHINIFQLSGEHAR